MCSRSQLLGLIVLLFGYWENEAADLQMCVENFVVHADKIIRTQDSRALGAKYLTEADVASRDDCLQICCETSTCDVFVFEQKQRGSCYLFHCGDPQDFKCKFTQHRNYTSGVLMPPTELEAQIKLTKHEDELAQLSKKSESEGGGAAAAVVGQEATARPTIITTKPPQHVKVNSTARSQCSRFQFECRSSHECIAIYNACDGITQCADGSDEGAELDCPTLTGTSQPDRLAHRKQLPVPIEAQGSSDVKKLYPAVRPQVQYTPYDEKLESLQAMEAQQELLNHVKNYGREGEGVGQDPSAMYRSYSEQRGKPQGEPSRMFAHKGGLATSEGDSIPVGSYGINEPGREYVKNGYYNSNPYQGYNYPQRQRDDPRWMYQQGQVGPPPPPPPPDYYYEESQMRRIPAAPILPANTNADPSLLHKAHVDDVSKKLESEKTTLTKVEEGKTRDKETVSVKKVITETTMQTTTTTAAAEPQQKKQPSHDRLEMSADDLVELETDGENEKPRIAILSLSLGMCVAAIMITLVGCRLRVVQRRLRRSGKLYANDADFLVNGMYL